MKAILQFNLPEDREEYTAAVQGMSLRLMIQEFDSWLRGELKYKELTEERTTIYEEMRIKVREMLSEDGICIDA